MAAGMQLGTRLGRQSSRDVPSLDPISPQSAPLDFHFPAITRHIIAILIAMFRSLRSTSARAPSLLAHGIASVTIPNSPVHDVVVAEVAVALPCHDADETNPRSEV